MNQKAYIESPLPSSGSRTLRSEWPTSTPPKKEKESRPRSALPRTPKKKGSAAASRKHSRSRRDAILRRLDVDPDALAMHPQIAPLMRLNGIRQDRLVEVLRCDTNPESMTFVQAWDKLTPAEQYHAGLEAVAVSVGILPRRLWELFAGAALVQSKESVAVMIAMSLPEVMAATIKGAKKVKGLADREHLFKAARVLPTPKGSTTNINLGGHKELEESEEEDDSRGDLVPADGFVLDAARIMNPQKALPPKRALDEVEEEMEEADD